MTRQRLFISCLLVAIGLLTFLSGCHPVRHYRAPTPPLATVKPLPPNAPAPLRQVMQSAIDQTSVTTAYDPAYVKIDYPNGDVPEDRGVCADVIVRAFRKGGIDLQKEVHEDMKDAW